MPFGVPPAPATVGASGAVMGLLLAYGLFYPDREILFFFVIPMKMKFFLLGTFFLSAFFMATGLFKGISHSGHLGGMLTGLIIFMLARKNHLFRPGNHTLNDFFLGIKNTLGLRNRPKYGPTHPDDAGFQSTVRKSGSSFFAKKNDLLDENKMTDKEIEIKIDELLQVISKKGLKGLSIEEQLFLDRVSRLYRHKFPE